jgi:hypothetical protein
MDGWRGGWDGWERGRCLCMERTKIFLPAFLLPVCTCVAVPSARCVWVKPPCAGGARVGLGGCVFFLCFRQVDGWVSVRDFFCFGFSLLRWAFFPLFLDTALFPHLPPPPSVRPRQCRECILTTQSAAARAPERKGSLPHRLGCVQAGGGGILSLSKVRRVGVFPLKPFPFCFPFQPRWARESSRGVGRALQQDTQDNRLSNDRKETHYKKRASTRHHPRRRRPPRPRPSATSPPR